MLAGTSNATKAQYKEGSGFFLHQSAAYPGNDQASSVAEKRRLELAFVGVDESTGGQLQLRSMNTMCMVADPAAAARSSSSGTVTTTTSPGVAGPTAMAGLGFAMNLV